MRRGQLLSIDALLSLVIVVMVVGVVMNTNDMIRAEITNLLDWYDRANICLLYTSPSPRDLSTSRMPSSA